MGDWVARYEEGYITAGGESVTIVDELHRDHPWASPREAQELWRARRDLNLPGVERFQNGLQQTDDVRARSEFSALGVDAVWRRVTFVPRQATTQG